MTDRKKPGVAFWATVIVVALLAYPLSFGPACWAYKWGFLGKVRLRSIYAPVFDHETDIPRNVRRVAGWYSGPDAYDRDMIVYLDHVDDYLVQLRRLVRETDAIIEAKMREIEGDADH
jgi:hypothetical protein